MKIINYFLIIFNYFQNWQYIHKQNHDQRNISNVDLHVQDFITFQEQ
jgi:hypothetical protein